MKLDLVRAAPEGGEKGQGMVFALVASILSLLALGLLLVWVNIERTKLAYRQNALQREVDKREELNSKLGIERDHLLSPQQLGERAAGMGLFNAKPGQIRRIDVPGGNATGSAPRKQ